MDIGKLFNMHGLSHLIQSNQPMKPIAPMHVYEIRPRKDKRGVDLISDALPFGGLWMLGIALGNWREAARQCGLSEGRVLNWVVRYGWKLPKRIEAPHPREVLSPVVGVVTPAESLQERLKHDAEATRLGLSTATRKASVRSEE